MYLQKFHPAQQMSEHVENLRPNELSVVVLPLNYGYLTFHWFTVNVEIMKFEKYIDKILWKG